MSVQQISNLLPVNFHGDKVYLVEGPNNEPYVVMGTVVKSMGLAWESQLVKLKSDKRLSMMMIVIETNAGPRIGACIPLRKFPVWLNGLNPKKIQDPLLKEKVIQYQDECDDVLWESWQIKVGAKPAPLALPQTYSEALRALADQSEQTEMAKLEAARERKQKLLALEAKSEVEEELGDTKALLDMERVFSMNTEKFFTIKEVSDALAEVGAELGQNMIYAWMREKKWLCSSGRKKNQPMRQYIVNGYLASHPVENGRMQTFVTPKGLPKLKRALVNDNLLDAELLDE